MPVPAILFLDYPRHRTLTSARELGLAPLVLLDETPVGVGRICEDTDALEARFIVLLRNRDVVAKHVRQRVLPRYDLRAIVTHNEIYVELAALLAEELGCPHHVSSVTARLCRDKLLMRNALQDAGLPVPHYAPVARRQDLTRFVESVGFPVVLKPRRGLASMGVIRADDDSALEKAYRDGRVFGLLGQDYAPRDGQGNLLVEQYIAGNEIAVETITYHGQTVVVAIIDKPLPLEGPFFEESIYLTPSALSEAQQAKTARVAAAVNRAVGIEHGPAHLEFRIDGSSLFPLEVAARTGSSFKFLTQIVGQSFDLIQLRSVLHLDLEPPTVRPQTDMYHGYYLIQARHSGTLCGFAGVENATEVAGITAVDLFQQKGNRIVRYPNFSGYIGTIYGRAETRNDLVGALCRAHDMIEVLVE